VVLNATEPGERCLLPALPSGTLEKSPFTLMADHYFDHCVDVFQRPNIPLYEWLRPRLAARQAWGLLVWAHVGCDLWRAEAASLREAFNLPLLLLDEHETRGVGPRLLTRLGAFVESLR
jgi:benzoyl-CoA reductase/2-hydroxyglutaryl-CoA dehydratase subunit BcrC/BadD/HgdB